MNSSKLDKVSEFDGDGRFKIEIDRTMALLRSFRKKYPFVKKPELINALTSNEIFNDSSGEVGNFFHGIEYNRKPIEHHYLVSKVYRNIRNKLDEFKDLLYVVVDKNKSIAQKVDANWEEISGMGDDRHIAKKIIFCFNYETNCVLPIFKTSDLEYFCRKITGHLNVTDRYFRMSLGEKYQFLNSELLRNKEKMLETKSWELAYFSRFLYETYPPPQSITSYVTSKEREHEKEKREQKGNYRNLVELLNKLKTENKISAVERRNYEKSWRNQPNNRDLLMKELEHKRGN